METATPPKEHLSVQHDSHEATPASESQPDTHSEATSGSILDHSPRPLLDAAAAQRLLQSLPSLLGSPIDNLTCQWVDCGERSTSAEALYDHVCDKHIGRKSTNNLNLTCHWGLCRISTVKRDHITSHMRVHVPLKPHKCDFCNKSFKRPQDLKKHVKTHADDSVGVPSPTTHHSHLGAGYGDDKGYYGNHDMGINSYSAPLNGHGGYFPQQYASYGAPGYAGASLADQQSMDTRRRAIEALNEFLGDIKRRSLDPKSYIDVGQRFNPQALPLPVSTGAGYSLGGSYQHAGQPPQGSEQYSAGGPQYTHTSNGTTSYTPAQNYALPMSNVRTKTDLQDIDRFLEQLQATVYDANPASQPGFREVVYNPAPGYNALDRPTIPTVPQPLTSVAQLASMAAASQGLDTPALTSASVSSHASSAHSPNASSSHSHSSMDGNMYPQLPSVTGISDSGHGYSSAPSCGLATSFEAFDSRRFRSGNLQRAAPADRLASIDSQAMDVDEGDGSRTPKKLADIKEDDKESRDETVDPALREELKAAKPTPVIVEPSKDQDGETDEKDSPSADLERKDSTSSTQSDSANDAWTENVRAIDALRNWIRERLEQGAYERDGDSTPTATHHEDTEMLDDAAEKDLGQALKHSLERQEAEAALQHAQQERENELHEAHDSQSHPPVGEVDMPDRSETRHYEHEPEPEATEAESNGDDLREQLRRLPRDHLREEQDQYVDAKHDVPREPAARQSDVEVVEIEDDSRPLAESEPEAPAEETKVSYPVLEPLAA